MDAEALPTRNAGFNLVEISLAVFVLALGLLAIFGLFPTGLGMADSARRETQAAMFADHVFGAMRANAMATEESWVDSVGILRGAVSFFDGYILLVDAGTQDIEHTGDTPQLAIYPNHGDISRHDTYLRYALNVNLENNGTVGTAELTVWTGRSGTESSVFYTQFYPYRKIVQ